MRTKYHPTFKSDYDKSSFWLLLSVLLLAAWIIFCAVFSDVFSPDEKNITGIIAVFFLAIVIFIFFARGNKLKKTSCAHCYQKIFIKEPAKIGKSYIAKCAPCRVVWDLRVKKQSNFNHRGPHDGGFHDD